MISIILPTYNGEKYIQQSISSILMQTYKEWELIIVDDCSTDNTPNILKKIVEANPKIRIFRNMHNKGLPESLNIGFRNSIGEYLTWTSDDNCYLPNALEVMLEELAQNDGLGMVFSKMKYIDSVGKDLGETGPPVMDISELKYKNIIGASFLYTRTAYEKVGNYNQDKFLVEDYDYWLRISRCCEIKYIPQILYKYRLHNNSLTESRNQEMLNAKIKLLEEELAVDNVSPDILCKIYKEIIRACLSADQHEKMCTYIDALRDISIQEYKNLDFKLRMTRHLTARQTRIIRGLYQVIKF